MGPLLIFDKSFLQMLNPEEVFELSMHFKLVGTPVVIREIIADLKKVASPGRIPRDVVRALAAKMGRTHALQPVNFRKAALANLMTSDIPMMGQVPVDTDAPNVHITNDGRGLLYDSVPEQHMWDRWARGEFDVADEVMATAWRKGLERVRLDAVRDNWRDFAFEHFCSATDIPSLISVIDGLLNDFDRDIQRELLLTILDFLRAPNPVRSFALRLFWAGLMPRVRDIAPYTASVARLCFTFVGGLARGFIGPRPSHYIDLEYLFYAPFCMVFVSSDKLHRELWPATAGVNSFVWGPELKADLAQRIDIRSHMTEAEREENRRTYGFYPVDIEGSVINKVWKKYMLPREEIIRPETTRAKTIDDLEPEIRANLKAAMHQFDKAVSR